MSEFWVFGYGSLMWNPGFPFQERQAARLNGFHRSLCIYSWVHRGTQSNPGLVFGLDHGGQCDGIAYQVSAQDRSTVIDYLRARELVTDVYLEQWHTIQLQNVGIVDSLVYVVDRQHAQYAGTLSIDQQIDIVRAARGKSGKNPEYVINTHEMLQQSGIQDEKLESLVSKIQKPD